MEAVTLPDVVDESRPIPEGMRFEHGKVVPHLTVEERVARGKAARREVPRSSHAGFAPGTLRPDPVALLEQQAASRVPELVPIRYGRMLVSPFTFYRGAALIMAADLAGTAAVGDHHADLRRRPPDELRRVRLTRAPDGVRPQRLRRDLPRAVGVGRQATGSQLRDCWSRQRVLGKERHRVLLTLVGDVPLDVPRVRGDVQPGGVVCTHRGRGCHEGAAARVLAPNVRKRAEANVAKARTRDSLQAFDKLTHWSTASDASSATRRSSSRSRSSSRESERDRTCTRRCAGSCAATATRCRATGGICSRSSASVDMARKVVGVGSVGTRAWIAADARSATAPTRCSCRPRKPGLGARGVRRRPDLPNHGRARGARAST